MSTTAIRVENLSKRYKLGVVGYGTLKDDLTSLWARVRGKADPNAQIGKESRIGQHGEFWALRDVSFSVDQGERIGIIGKNGAGKSTLLKILSRITAPTEGRIKVNGRIASLLEVGTGFHGELTGRENVFLNGAILGMKRGEIQRKFDEIVEFSGISDFIDTPVKRYSSGMFVRLAFSVAAFLDADIMVLDEVLTVGDTEFQKKCIDKLEQVSKGSGRTIILVSHIMPTIKSLCTRGLLLKDGLCQAAGPIDEIISSYLGSAQDTENGLLVKEVDNADNNYSHRVVVSKWWIADSSGSPVSGVLYNSQQYYVHVDMECKSDETSLACFLSFYVGNDDPFLISDICKSARPTPGYNKKGKKHLIVEIPRNLLAARDYQVSFSAVFQGDGWPLLPSSENRLKFTYMIDDFRHPFITEENDHPFNGSRKPGVVDPTFSWSVE